MTLYVLKKTFNENNTNFYIVEIAVSKNEQELEDLLQRCNKFETSGEDWDWEASDHPGGFTGNAFRYLEGFVEYVINEIEFEDDIDSLIYEAEVKSRISKSDAVHRKIVQDIEDSEN